MSQRMNQPHTEPDGNGEKRPEVDEMIWVYRWDSDKPGECQLIFSGKRKEWDQQHEQAQGWSYAPNEPV